VVVVGLGGYLGLEARSSPDRGWESKPE
jgi:hypothetical protein